MSHLRLHRAVSALHQGQLIAYPTEAVYGLGCDPWNEQAVHALLAIKNRCWRKGLILVAADKAQLTGFIHPINSELAAEIDASWPGPTTWVLPVKDNVPEYLTGQYNTIAVRVTAHRQTAELCRQFGGAIVSTSANLAGKKPAKSIRQVRWHLPEINIVLSGCCAGSAKPTQIRDGQTGVILR